MNHCSNTVLHSGYEIADTVIYEYHRGTYIVMKADPITRQIGEGDVLFRQCVSLFSKPYALVLYLNPYETAPFVIENEPIPKQIFIPLFRRVSELLS